MAGQTAHFANAASVQTYAENARRIVPGLDDLHRMTLILLSESSPPEARLLVVGAGGGMELALFAKNRPNWQFDGVDPSGAMLSLASETLGPFMSRVTLHEGYIDTAPDGPYDAATCLLTLHFLSRQDRLHTLQQIRRRLKRGGVFVMAHHSIAQDAKSRADWTRRFAAYGSPTGTLVASDHPSIFDQLPILAPDQEELLLREAGFGDVTPFYAAFSFRGWAAYA